MTTTNEATKTNRIVMLDVSKDGKITERLAGVGQENFLDNTLLGTLYPGIKVALVTVPTEILEYAEAAAVTDKLVSVEHEGVTYRMVGASGSAKNGKYYFADSAHAPALAKRFQNWPEAAITYFGILTSSCKALIEEPNARVIVVPDNTLGTNDCRGWIRRSLFSKLHLSAGHMYQVRVAFGDVQAKGLLKIMEDDVADVLGVDIIFPESSVKPPMKLDASKQNALGFPSITITGHTVIGVREVSHNLKFESSYTVLQHAPEKVIMTEIVPQARDLIRELSDAWHDGNHRKVVEMIGKRVPSIEEEDDAIRDDQFQTIESVLLADGSGELTRHPYVQNVISRLIARWAYKLLTGGGLQIPAFTLGDDGYLFLHDGKVMAGSDWLPLDYAIVTSPIESDRGLNLRYPVRMAEDLLPMKHANVSKAAEILVERQMLTPDAAKWVAENQLCLAGTYNLHSKTAKRNGGDFDGDMVGVIDANKYPEFVEFRFNLKEHEAIEKTKAKRSRSPWYNLEFVALKSLGNQIGVITNLQSAAIANGRGELVYTLVPELQKEIDSLKHNTRADRSILKGIREQLVMPKWLGMKDPKSLDDLDPEMECLPTDRVGKCYRVLRNDITEMMGEAMAVSQFAGLLMGNTPTTEMFEECRLMLQVFAAGHGIIREALNKERESFEASQKKLNASIEAKASEDEIGKLRKEFSKARASLRMAEEKNKERSSSLHSIIAAWGSGKQSDRNAWCQALHTLVCKTKSAQNAPSKLTKKEMCERADKMKRGETVGQLPIAATGSIVFHAFPQEMVDAIANRTNGMRTTVAPKKVRGTVRVEEGSKLFYLGTAGKTYLFSYDEKTRSIRK